MAIIEDLQDLEHPRPVIQLGKSGTTVETAVPAILRTKKRSLRTDTVIISDVHLGSDVCRAKDLRKALAEWYPFRRLIILGDLFDDLNFSRLKKNHFGLLDDFRKLTKPRRGVTIDWVEGNHDETADKVIPHLIGARIHKQLMLEMYGKKYLFIHGHQFDDFLNDHPVVTGIASRFYESVQRREGDAQKVSRWLKRQSKTWVKAANHIETRARSYASRFGADTVLCGHTHYYNANTDSGDEAVQYYNTGCWADSPSTLTTIDDKGLRRHLYR